MVNAYSHNQARSWVFYDGTNQSEVQTSLSSIGYTLVGVVDAEPSHPYLEGALVFEGWQPFQGRQFVTPGYWYGPSDDSILLQLDDATFQSFYTVTD